MTNWQGKHILVIGAARQGLAASRYLAGHDARVILNDSRSRSEFKKILPDLEKRDIRFHFGGHPKNLLEGIDLVCVSGGVPLELPILQTARNQGITLTNDSQLFMQDVKARVIGITGSAGKTTTTIICGEIAKAGVSSPHKVWIGGNIGFPLIESMEEMGAEDWAVVELSSFQLELMDVSPHIALVLNITPNHLDRHKNMQAYTTAKAHIVRYQTDSDFAILNRDDPGSMSLADKTKAKILTFGFDYPGEKNGCFVHDDHIMMKFNDELTKLAPVNALHLPGRHNLANAMAACTAAYAAGFTPEAMQEGIDAVKGVPHRLELVRERQGVSWFNDSIATAPERVIAAVNAVEEPMVLLLGGRDKDLPWGDLADLLSERKPKVILFGEAGDLVKNALKKTKPDYPIHQVKSLEDAVNKAAKVAEAGEYVLLSPGGTSFDAYRDFEERGEHFRSLVKELK